MEGAVVSDDLAGEKSQTDDDQEDCVETGAGDEQTGPENSCYVSWRAGWAKQGSSDELPRIRRV